jgi:hypothetical protein
MPAPVRHAAVIVESVQDSKFRQLIMQIFEMIPYGWFRFSLQQRVSLAMSSNILRRVKEVLFL